MAQKPNDISSEQFRVKFWSRFKITEGSNPCWLWTGAKDKDGYGIIVIRGMTANGNVFVHRVAYLITHGSIPDGHGVLHKCDTPSCARPTHLFSGTQVDNMKDAASKNRTAIGDKNGMHTHTESRPRGERNGRARLTKENVIEIKRRLLNGTTHETLASEMKVCRQHITDISNGRKWGWLKLEESDA